MSNGSEENNTKELSEIPIKSREEIESKIEDLCKDKDLEITPSKLYVSKVIADKIEVVINNKLKSSIEDKDIKSLVNEIKSIYENSRIKDEHLGYRFSLQEFRKSFKEYPEGTIRRVLQELRDEGCLEFIDGCGGYLYPYERMYKSTLQDKDEYLVKNIVDEGSFLSEDSLDNMLDRLKSKKNIILQGPPGTGKTWLAKRLGLALVGKRDESKVRAVQFHPNLSYEDFIRGWRPTGNKELGLVDGPFMEMIRNAKNDPKAKHVIIIEEINRGNPAKIFGEMLTLLESDKRIPSEALELSYKRDSNERVFIPENLYVIGTMNLADHSIASLDFALRRRFAFINLEPTLNDKWKKWVHSRNGISEVFLENIKKRVEKLNEDISVDLSLGPQFKIGHSYITPTVNTQISNYDKWFEEVVNTEIGPLLDEYWFDDHNNSRSRTAKNQLLKDL
ncbi:AAA family ATPase [Psychrobacter sp. Ps1]|uniref:McrB family protein n=1 Tax=Psychrobacter sp. Ps1 TaxID=2790955 RepID=UPI001EE03944|nr:AAA family ATPase [Psychrobacter sp. Ps1]MCG3841909.1 AAA family ATPase [Psychrobacter sp. Ps1]